MKLSLLDMTQQILSAMESDDVNSIGDTEESSMVATAIKETYFDIISSRDWPFLRTRTNLVALGDTSNPTKMQFPENCDKVFWIKYNKKDVSYKEPKEFQDMIDKRVVQAGVVDSNGFQINKDPTYWTSFDDNFIFFDSYDDDVDATLQSSKSQAMILLIPTWVVDNEFVPTLPDKMFPMLLADAKATCFLNHKQMANPKEERKAQRLKIRMSKESVRANDAEEKHNGRINFGRR